MKPIIILPPNVMSSEDIKMLRDNDLCVVIAKDPNAIKFLDPIPVAASRTELENAAIALSRKILTKGTYDSTLRSDFAKMYVDLLVRGTSLDPEPTEAELNREIFDMAKADELQRLGIEEAKAERAEAKKKVAKPTGATT